MTVLVKASSKLPDLGLSLAVKDRPLSMEAVDRIPIVGYWYLAMCEDIAD
jgi:hypothetical protein